MHCFSSSICYVLGEETSNSIGQVISIFIHLLSLKYEYNSINNIRATPRRIPVSSSASSQNANATFPNGGDISLCRPKWARIFCVLYRLNQEKRPRRLRFLPTYMPNAMRSVKMTKTGRRMNQIFSDVERGAL
jgi:hypothetical protein